ncbi:MAG TPA: exodeoxyribonuclease VII small subunit [Candidatus Saccharimonadales bacterium]|nr:exodeoxyribonuclease VII small subunit [Candidatus Saccharimonadales bacterium]
MATNTDYKSASKALDEVLAKLQKPDIQVDEAVKLYEEGLRLIKQCETHLTEAENKIEQLTLQAGAPG